MILKVEKKEQNWGAPPPIRILSILQSHLGWDGSFTRVSGKIFGNSLAETRGPFRIRRIWGFNLHEKVQFGPQNLEIFTDTTIFPLENNVKFSHRIPEPQHPISLWNRVNSWDTMISFPRVTPLCAGLFEQVMSRLNRSSHRSIVLSDFITYVSTQVFLQRTVFAFPFCSGNVSTGSCCCSVSACPLFVPTSLVFGKTHRNKAASSWTGSLSVPWRVPSLFWMDPMPSVCRFSPVVRPSLWLVSFGLLLEAFS